MAPRGTQAKIEDGAEAAAASAPAEVAAPAAADKVEVPPAAAAAKKRSRPSAKAKAAESAPEAAQPSAETPSNPSKRRLRAKTSDATPPPSSSATPKAAAKKESKPEGKAASNKAAPKVKKELAEGASPSGVKVATPVVVIREWETAKLGATSRYLGVGYHKATGRWQVNVKSKYLGLYDTEEEAAEARYQYLKTHVTDEPVAAVPITQLFAKAASPAASSTPAPPATTASVTEPPAKKQAVFAPAPAAPAATAAPAPVAPAKAVPASASASPAAKGDKSSAAAPKAAAARGTKRTAGTDDLPSDLQEQCDKLAEATSEEEAAMPNWLKTFAAWLAKKDLTDRAIRKNVTTLRALFEEHRKGPAAMASAEYFAIVKASPKNKASHNDRSYSLAYFKDFHAQHVANAGKLEDAAGDAQYCIRAAAAKPAAKKQNVAASLTAAAASAEQAEKPVAASASTSTPTAVVPLDVSKLPEGVTLCESHSLTWLPEGWSQGHRMAPNGSKRRCLIRNSEPSRIYWDKKDVEKALAVTLSDSKDASAAAATTEPSSPPRAGTVSAAEGATPPPRGSGAAKTTPDKTTAATAKKSAAAAAAGLFKTSAAPAEKAKSSIEASFVQSDLAATT